MEPIGSHRRAVPRGSANVIERRPPMVFRGLRGGERRAPRNMLKP
jgi:hypothetical protein